MAKQIVFDMEARKYFKQGSDMLLDAVKVTLGPRGRNVALEQRWGAPTSTHDGATVSKDFAVKNQFINMGISIIKEAAKKTSDEVGDGTTTSTILAQAMITEGFKNIAAGAEAVSLKHGLEKATAAVINELKLQAKPVSTREDITKVATITSHNQEIGKVIGEILYKVGKNGVVTVEEGKGINLEVEYTEGMKFDRGYISPHFVTDTQKMTVEIDDPYILITDKKLESIKDLLPILEKLTAVSRNIVIIADDVEKEALAALVVNKIKGALNCLAVKAPTFGDRRKAMLEDIAILTGGQVITEDKGLKLDGITMQDLGRARRVECDKDNIVIIEGKGDKKDLQARIKQIKNEIALSDTEFDKEKLQDRLSKLSGGVGLVKVGAPTETELKEKKSIVQGALSATRAATEEGILPGGGVAFMNAAKVIDSLKLKGDEMIGAKIVQKALEAPLKQLASNSGQNGNVVLSRVKEMKPGYGYDVVNEDYAVMLERGIVDPFKVMRIALQNASSAAAMALITEALVTDKVEEKEDSAKIK